MINRLDDLLARYERGGFDRRGLLQSMAAMVAGAATGVRAAEGIVQARSLHHVEIKSVQFAKVAEFYGQLLGVKPEMRADRAVVSLPGNAHLSIGAAPTQGSIDHYALAIADFKPVGSLVKKLTGAGCRATERGNSVLVVDPDGRQFQLVPPDFKP